MSLFRRDKERTKKAQSRLWYQTEPHWVDSAEFTLDAPLPFDLGSEPHTPDRAEEGGMSPNREEEIVVMRSGEERPICQACFEPIEVTWDDGREEWIAKGAVRDGDDLYHVRCISATHDDSAPAAENVAVGSLKRTADEAGFAIDDEEERALKRLRGDAV